MFKLKAKRNKKSYLMQIAANSANKLNNCSKFKL